MSQLNLETSSLTLVRYPLSAQETALQAWEAADEYLLRELADMPLGDGPRLIFNDAFGALACGLQAQSTCSISDSYLSQLATRHNLALNGFDADGVTLLDSLSDLPAAPALVVIKVPKTLALLENQLRMLSQVVTPQTVVIAGAKARDIHTSTLALFEQILGPTKTSLAWKKARLVHCQPDGRGASDRLPLTEWPVPEHDLQIVSHANVFARGGLDIGARLFIQHLPQQLEGKVVDLGCGNGVVGLTALDLNPQATISFLDESYMAVASSRKNVALNRPRDLDRCGFAVNNSLTGIADGSLQAVLCNPPFHQQQAISGDIAWQMFTDAKRCLGVGGELRIVGNRHLNYFQKLKRLFGNCETLASNPKFVVLRAIKSAVKRRESD
ncbi:MULTISPECIES: 23S rRNA (guanine(1835)-N(2))-methyltransferase RlmG [Lonsdalea]|uniref:23S rRNA (Guanine(1835)-N(2))-methyltransferase n=2 Tax=Lonsdalea TaxID=1082702 RepID=A0ACD1JB91_9GAMM|nr:MULTISPECIES: 23S rRNA (guanine(1835)-N(2))-methyltransferase RlmG [Lonsdalea]OSM96651.1 23S rRNA (guanine(1835)-N(2))-methyltransferase [Lonsdalea populi]RAT12413.1 23S rRNA (guanine(1835)-N(2))-methyltransferase [Lonsdalea quercina]RAT14151.1 23S rRNA (guanine(1835)-N(2))-methyltransferase [Lonsdalea quercina]RAT19640.1 23S rRNA (guanine(1835)-N(2))-methyltransferase [Lonsdalea populi]RAT21526.1 23S rRNA (guanine(1835)-N(2))-methyltransferase [Lonsdalea populi]